MTTATKIDVTRALAIPGWMEEPELEWLAGQAVEHRCIVEIGSYLGRSTRALLDHAAGVVYAVDDWYGPRDVYLDKWEREELFEKFLKNTIDSDTRGKLYVVKIDHQQVDQLSVEPDMVFIDGGHEYEDVRRDVEIWLPRVVSGGLICGHDAGWKSVGKALIDAGLGDAVIAPNTTIWYKVV